MTNWQPYYENTKNLPPNKSLVDALNYVKNKDTALDLGSGAFRDSKFLLNHFKNVVAVDKEYSANLILNQPYKLNFINTTFEKFKFEHYDLINAQYSLPFMKQKDFLKVWHKMVKSLNPGGIFVGQLFGVDDEWNDGRDMTFFKWQDISFLFSGLRVLKFKEEKGMGKLADGSPKMWHVYHITLQK